MKVPVWRPGWAIVALAAGVVLGLVSDSLVAGPYFNLLSPLLWGLIGWNLALYVWMGLQAARGGSGALRPWLARWLSPLPAVDDLATARAAALLHAAAAGVALGLAAGLVLRGLVLDYRAGWATTLLATDAVQAALRWGFEPARLLTGIAAPDRAAVEALRIVPGQAATASAAPWIGLMVAQLAVWIMLPRLLLTVLALRRGAEPPAGTRFWVLPLGVAPAPRVIAGLQALLARRFGAGAQLQIAAPLAWGDEDRPPPVPAGARAVLLVDLATTPEAEVHGRLLQALASARPLVVADEAGFVQRFGRGERLDQRLAAWRALAGPVDMLGDPTRDPAP